MGYAVNDFFHVVDRTGIAALTLQPISVRARNFYSGLGFEVADETDRPLMFLPAETVLELRLKSAEYLREISSHFSEPTPSGTLEGG